METGNNDEEYAKTVPILTKGLKEMAHTFLYRKGVEEYFLLGFFPELCLQCTAIYSGNWKDIRDL